MKTTVQDKTVWGLADTGSCRNLINEDFYQQLPIKGTMFPPGTITVIAGDGNMLDLLGWTVLKMEVGNEVIYHEVGVVKDLPFSVLMGGEMMRPHCCSLQYAASGRNTFNFGVTTCSICKSNLAFLKGENSPQLFKLFIKKPTIKLQTFALIPANRVTVAEMNTQ